MTDQEIKPCQNEIHVKWKQPHTHTQVPGLFVVTDQVINEAVARKLGVEPMKMWDSATGKTVLIHRDYSNDIAAAWEIVEFLITNGQVIILAGSFAGWNFGIVQKKISDTEELSQDDSAPMAICLAFLQLK